MKIQSPLSNLSDVFIQVQQSASQYRSTLVKNEASTRAVLIDPVLRALGWEIASTNMVEVEKILGQMRADYALFDGNGDVKVIVEAKQLGSNLLDQKVVMSLVNYAFQAGIENIFLTDGIVWRHFDRFTPGNVNLAKEINIEKDDLAVCGSYLVQVLDATHYWPNGPTVDILQQEIDQVKNEMASIKLRLNQAGIGVTTARQIPLTGTPKISSQYVDVDVKRDYTDTKPSKLRLPDGNEVDVTSWKEVLRETCKFVMGLNNKLSVPLPDASGRKVCLLSVNRPSTGISFVKETYQGKDVYIYLNYSASRCAKNALYILQYAPAQYNNASLQVVL